MRIRSFFEFNWEKWSHFSLRLQFYLLKVATQKKSMKANHVSRDNFSMAKAPCSQICENTQEKCQQFHFSHKSKNSYWGNSSESNNDGKTLRLNHCKVSNQRQRKQETHEDLEQLALNTKKQAIRLSNDLEFIRNNQQESIVKNCQISPHHYHSQIENIPVLNCGQKIQTKKINYNNSIKGDKINLQSTQNLNMTNQLLFIPQRTQIDIFKLSSTLKNQQLHIFLQGESVVFPVPDFFLERTLVADILGSHRRFPTSKYLPIGFCQMLQLLNLSYLFPENFKIELETITLLDQILQTTVSLKDYNHLPQLTNQINQLLSSTFIKYMKLLTELLIQDLNSQRLQLLSNAYTYNVLSLGKFCQQNQLLQFVFEYNWPIIMLQLAKLYLQFPEDNCQIYQKCVNFLQNHIKNQFHEIPQSFQDRFLLISMLIDCYSKTGSFRELFNKKTQTSRNVNKRKTLLQEQKKVIQLKIKKIISNNVKKYKKITKPSSKKNKKHNSQQESQNESRINQFNDNHSQFQEDIQKLRSQLEQINQELEKQNRQDSLSACHYLGKDRFGQLYWYVTFFSDKLFVQGEKVWGCLNLDDVKFVLEGLDRRGIEQNKLLDKLTQYYSHQLVRHSTRIQPETQSTTTLLYKPTNLFHTSSTLVDKTSMNNMSTREQKSSPQQQQIVDEGEENDSSKNSIQNNELLIALGGFKVCRESLVRMVEVGDRKMTEYLKERNSRWGSEENRVLLVIYFSYLFSSMCSQRQLTPVIFGWLKLSDNYPYSTKKFVLLKYNIKYLSNSLYNRWILRLRKYKVMFLNIKAKIWGINQKYKHNWYDFVNNCSNFTELFFAVSVLYSLIKKYTSKQRKLRKQYEQVKLKSVWKVTSAVKQWKQQWNEQCQVCGSNGQVLCCDYCPKVYHLQCINLGSIPEQQFKCKSCKQQITTRNQFKSLANSKKKHKK